MRPQPLFSRERTRPTRRKPRSVQAACIEKSGTMQLVAYFRTDYPGLSFERELIERIAGYSLSMDCDFYFPYSGRQDAIDNFEESR